MLRQRTSRRVFLKGTGALVVSISFASSLASLAEAAPVAAVDTNLKPDPTKLDSWLHVGGDGSITAFTSKVELGQGNQTALTQIVAEELDVPFGMVNLVMGDSARSAHEFATSASLTIQDAGSNLRQAAAEARKALLDLAAKQLRAPAGSLSVSNGVVSRADGSGKLSYAQLIGNRDFNIQLKALTTPDGMLVPFTTALSGSATPKDPSTYTIVGTSVPRIDIPPKVTGEFTYMQDVKVPGMLHGRVVRPTGIRSKLIGIGSFDPPVTGAQVVTKGDFVGVVAPNEWDAIRAQSALQVAWSDWNGLPDMSDMWSFIRGTDSTPRQVKTTGDVDAGMASAATTLSATYQTPFEMHGSIGPSCAVADVQGDKATIWSGTQDSHGIQADLATLLDIPAANIHVMNVEASGCYGHNGADLVTFDAALMSQLTGKPVRVQFMRSDEHGWEPKGPAMVQDFSGGVDADGNVVAYTHAAWIPPHFDGVVLTGELVGKNIGFPLPGNLPNWATDLIYAYPNVSINEYEQSEFANAIRTAFLRGPAWFQLVFAKEAFVDELAAAAGRDPVEFRLASLTDKRDIDVLNAVANAAGWESRPSPRPGASATGIRTGRGVAMVNYDGTHVAEVAEVEVNGSTGNVRVTRFWVAHDCGLIINPKAVQAQIESNIIQATSRTLKEEVTFDQSNVTSLDWVGYPILTYPEVPQVETILINRPDVPSTGAGEPSTCPVPAAISNAIFDATGVRLRTLPLRPNNVQAAFAALT
ncbi:MAG TPA: molybdopterin cofactor-binding domain-containing protein [Chloroflexota bacterium]|nr:molybdopterin cofactor-binding domain-containing protein [Chloroflexota bacterium]